MEARHPVAMPSDLHSRNFSNILNAICRKKQFTITEIAESTHMSRQTVTKSVNRLIEQGIVVPTGKGSSTSIGGKKPICFSLNDHAYVICMCSSAHHTRFSLMNLMYQQVDVVKTRDIMNGPLEDFIRDSVHCCRELLERNPETAEHLMGLSFCFGGIVEESTGTIRYSCVTPGWGRNIPIGKILKEALGLDVAISVDNISKICARTMISNENLNQKNVLVMYCDQGLGVTHIEEGVIRPSVHGVAHEWGHMVLSPWDEEICGCGGRGCVEVLIGEKRIRRKIEALPETQRNALLQGYDGTEDLRIHVMKKAETGDASARELTAYMADLFGLMIRNIYLGVDPDYLVLQGAFARATDSFLERARQKAGENHYFDGVTLEIRQYDRDLKALQEIGGVNTVLRRIAESPDSEHEE